MKRTPLARKTPLRTKAPMRKRSAPKMTAARRSAKGQACTIMLPGCSQDRETVVLCHLRMLGGGGVGMKPPDTEAVYGCAHCHGVLDGRARLIPELAEALNWETICRALVRTHRIMRAEGVLILKGERKEASE